MCVEGLKPLKRRVQHIARQVNSVGQDPESACNTP